MVGTPSQFGTMVNPASVAAARSRSTAKAPESRAQRLRFPPGPLLFQMGLPALDVFPRKQWSQIATRVVRSVDVEQLAHPHDILGYEPLRQAIASYLRIARDIACTADQIMITAGFQGALGFIIQALLAPRDEVWVDDPGYFFAHELLRGCVRLAPSPSTTRGSTLRPGTRIAPDVDARRGHADASVSARHDAAGRSPPCVARLGRPQARLHRGRRLRLRIPPPRLAAAGAQEPRSLRSRSLCRVVSTASLPMRLPPRWRDTMSASRCFLLAPAMLEALPSSAPKRGIPWRQRYQVTIPALQQMKRDGKKSVGVVAWDYQIARIADRAGVDFVSVGDSVGVNLWGHANPLEVTLDEILVCCKAVRRGAARALVSCDVPVRPGAGGRRRALARRHPPGQGRRRRHGQGRCRGRFPRGRDGAHPRRHSGVRAVRAHAADRAEIRHPLQRAEFARARRRPRRRRRSSSRKRSCWRTPARSLLDFTNSGPVAGAAVVQGGEDPGDRRLRRRPVARRPRADGAHRDRLCASAGSTPRPTPTSTAPRRRSTPSRR